MAPTTNPYSSDPLKAEIFEQGYLVGFQDPAGNDNDFRPFAPELLDIYVEGADAGRADAHLPPGGDDSKSWVEKSDLGPQGEDSTDEAVEHLSAFVIFKVLEKITSVTALGLLDLVLMAVGIQGNVSPQQLQPLPDNFSQTYEGQEKESIFYVAACPRKDHVSGAPGVDQTGMWCGSGQHDFIEALREAMRHEHLESVVARCDAAGETCSLVWLAK